MQRITILMVLGLLLSVNAMACDACGCGISSTYWGLIPNNSAGFVGVWYQHQHFQTDLTYLQEDGQTFYSYEDFNTFDWRARYSIGEGIFLSAMVPYVYHQRQYGDQSTTISGLGDVTLLGTFTVLNTTDSLLSNVRHRLTLGGGVKLPTGKFRIADNQEVVNPNFQAGTGSLDFLLQASYTARLNNFGMQIDGIYKINTTNPDEYKFGNQLTGSANFFYLQALGAFEIMPTAGVTYEQAEKDVERGFFQRTSGGQIFSAQAGLELYWDRFNIGANYIHPLQQKWADGVIEANPRWSVHASFFF
jgi:hypothetical protein